MHVSTKKWLFTKISSFLLIPFMIWFIVSFISIYENDYQTVVTFFTEQPSKILFSIKFNRRIFIVLQQKLNYVICFKLISTICQKSII